MEMAIINPKSGRYSEDLPKRIQEIISSLQIYMTKEIGDAENYLKNLEGVKRIIIAGGDGTISEVINGLKLRSALLEDDLDRLPTSEILAKIALIPCGTGNNLARDLGIKTIEEGLQSLTSTRLASVKVVKVTNKNQSRLAINTIISGLPANINQTASYLSQIWPSILRRMIGLRYDLAALRHLFNTQPLESKIKVEDQIIAEDFIGFFGQITKRAGNNTILAPNANLGDEFCHLIILNMRDLLRKLITKRDFSIKVQKWEMIGEGYVTLDGQNDRIALPLICEVLPNYYYVQVN